ncbi:hypothetical protein J8273_6016 [Carpediemonas membranifera]|uniref:Uncharacterized protein n=1 Tax=Carpediemonas membranifera TaxID=201153 RepID=A0A8J6E907_9EUKA|nr:hypothetical protein J8273_6016 [Carpediemonas membranifera]|eukprot:KAG9392650.1 hypothetical protein J8273_6016 [Carpediemonas membranifera]
MIDLHHFVTTSGELHLPLSFRRRRFYGRHIRLSGFEGAEGVGLESEPESPIAGEPESFADYVDILWRHYHNFIDGSDELVWRLGEGTLNEAGSHPGNFRAAWQLSRVATTLRTWASRGHIARDNDRLIASRFLKAYLGLTRLWATARCPDGWGIPHTTPDIVWRAVMQGAHPALHRLLVGAEAHGLMVEYGQAFVSVSRHEIEKAWVRHSGAPTVDARLDCALAGLELEFPADLGLFYGEDVTLETLLTLQPSDPGRPNI